MGFGSHAIERGLVSAITLNSKSASQLLKEDKARLLCLDTETTGLDSSTDEVVSLSVINGNEDVLFDHLVKPVYRRCWPNATRINGIAPRDVMHEKPLSDYLVKLSGLATSCHLLIGYNLEFDLALLECCGCCAFSGLDSFDVMAGFSFAHGTWRGHSAPRWYRLSACANYYSISYEPHSSLEDARATMRCFFSLLHEVARDSQEGQEG